jgi:glycogen operon protein
MSEHSGLTASPRHAWAEQEGTPLPLGATWLADERAYNFALYSKHADRVTLVLFADGASVDATVTVSLDPLRHKSGRVWHCRLTEAEMRGCRYYAYSVAGPAPAGRTEWHAFDPDKILLDPYAPAVYFPPAFSRTAAALPGSNAGRAPLGVLPAPHASHDECSIDESQRAPVHESDAVIYELHVRNFTRHPSSGVATDTRGTFAGVIEKIPYLVELGITIVELMPVFQNDPGMPDRWGYMPLSFFAVERSYSTSAAPDAPHEEFRNMVSAFHRAGIEVVIDVVYNHTCERGADGPTYSFKGIDNSTYYLMTGNASAPYADYSGTGNTMHCGNQAVRKMVLDGMRHWRALGVDGFRFDLASIYARGEDGAIRLDDPPIFGEIAADPDFATVRMIAEPWDSAAYQLGRGFAGSTWQQWNGSFRDDIRRFVRGDPGMVPAVMRRLYGSDDLFPDDLLHAYRPSQSVNYVTCHDGPTLYDLVSYNYKHNWANGQENRDGPPQSFTWNCGWEGDNGLPDEVAALRIRQAKNLLTLLFLANGTPMLRAGDEFLHTQEGNDNPYNQDNATTWLDWTRQERYAEMVRFTKLAIEFRKMHPSLGRSRFWRDDVRWYSDGSAAPLSPEAQSIAYCLHGSSQRDDDIYVMINASQQPMSFEIREGHADDWRRVIDTARPSPDDFRATGDAAAVGDLPYLVSARSIVVLVRPRQS